MIKKISKKHSKIKNKKNSKKKNSKKKNSKKNKNNNVLKKTKKINNTFTTKLNNANIIVEKLLNNINNETNNYEKSLLKVTKRLYNSGVARSLKKIELCKKEYNNYLHDNKLLFKNIPNNNLLNVNINVLNDILYPSILDNNFNEIIFNNKIMQNYYVEDNTFMIDKLKSIYIDNKKNKQITENTNSYFKLSNPQKILRNFMSLNTNYRNLLLNHGTGVGKTCSAVTIAENLKNFIHFQNKKIHIIRADEFKRQIFDKNTLYNNNTMNQCTGETYINEVLKNKYKEEIMINCKLGDKVSCARIEKLIKKEINKYYEFYTPYTWAKMVEKNINLKTSKLTGIQKQKKTIEVIRNIFNDALLIIDEAHNLRDSGSSSNKNDKNDNKNNIEINIQKDKTSEEKDKNSKEKDKKSKEKDKKSKEKDKKSKEEDIIKKGKIVPPILNKVLLYSQNLRLVLLSATPMYDKPSDVITLLNYMLLNDKRPILSESEIFDSEFNIKSKLAEKKLIDSSRGYISYIRGNDPINFPIRLSCKYNIPEKILNLSSYPKIDINSNTLKNKIKYFELINCPFSKDHQNVLFKFINNLKNKKEKIKINNSLNNKDDIVDDESVSEYIKSEIDDSVKNIDNNFSVAYISELQISNFIYQTYNESGKNINLCYGLGGFNIVCKKIPKNITYKFNDPEYGQRFLKNNLKKYSHKFFECLNNIEKSNGPVLVYSYFTSGGVIPMAFALEMAGYRRYNNEPELLQNKYKNNKNMGEYIIYTGNEQLSKGAELFFNKRSNMIKEKNVKVVLVSKKGSEGLNLWGFREIHILDPWHNINLLEQVIGRVIRNNSHSHLKPENRNVSIYMYASTLSGEHKNKESVDLRVYNICEQKVIQSSKVELLLKKNAIDCKINKYMNYRPKKLFKEDIEINTSHNIKINYNLSDKPFTKDTLYMKNSDYKCYGFEDSKSDKLSKNNKIIYQKKNTNNLNDNNLNDNKNNYFDSKFINDINIITKKKYTNFIDITEDINISLYQIEIKELIGIIINKLKNNLNLTILDIYNIIQNEYPTLVKQNVSFNIINYILDYLENYDKIIINNNGKKCNIVISIFNNIKLIRLLSVNNLNPNVDLFYQDDITIDKIKGKILNFTKNKKLFFDETIYKGFSHVNTIKINDYIQELIKRKITINKEEEINYNLILLKISNSINNIIYKLNKSIKNRKGKSTKEDDLLEFQDKIIPLKTNITFDNSNNYDILISIFFDKLYLNEKVFLLQNLIHRKIKKKTLSNIEKKILIATKYNIVYNNEIFKLDDKNKEIYGFIIAFSNKLLLYKYLKKEYLGKSKKDKSIDVYLDQKNLNKFWISDKTNISKIVKKRYNEILNKNLNKLFGYLLYTKSIMLPPEFKITDYLSKGLKKSVKGISCSSKPVNEILSYIKIIEPNYKNIAKNMIKNKKIVCSDLEILFRFSNKNNKENKIYFLNPEEYYIWMLNNN